MRKSSWNSFFAASGLLGLIPFTAQFYPAILFPHYGDSEASIVWFYQTYSMAYLINLVLSNISILLLLCFLCYLYSVFRRDGRERGSLPILMLVASMVWAIMTLLMNAFAQMLALMVARPEGHPLLRLILDFDWMLWTYATFPVIIMIGAASLCLWRLSMAPRWFCLWGGVITIALHLPMIAPMIIPDLLAPLTWPIVVAYVTEMLWVGLTSLFCLRWEHAQARQAEHAPGVTHAEFLKESVPSVRKAL